MSEVQSKRKLFLDVTRGIGILLVLLGHNNPPFIYMIYGFHMPLFFIISGYLYKDSETTKPIWDEIRKILTRYLLPYCILGTINLALHVVHIRVVAEDHQWPAWSVVKEYIIALLTANGEHMPACGPLWFLFSLAISLFTFYLIRKIPAFTVRAIIMALCIVATALLEGHELLYSLHTVCIAIVFLEMGYLLKGYGVIEKLSEDSGKLKGSFKLILVSVAISATGMILVYFNNHDRWIDISVARFGIVPLTVVSATLVTYGIMFGVSFIERIIPNVLKPFAYIGRHTLLILAFDFQSNYWGGSIIHKYRLFDDDPTWYQAFLFRLVILIGFFLLWQLFRMIVPGKKLKQLLDY